MRFLGFALLAALLCGTCHADTVPASYQVNVSAPGVSASSAGFTTQSQQVGDLIPVGNSDGMAQALAGPNLLGVYAYAAASYYGIAGADAGAQLADTLVLNNAPTNGTLTFYLDINGSSYISLLNGASGLSQVQIDLGGECIELVSNPNAQDCKGSISEGINTIVVPYYNLNPDGYYGFDIDFYAGETCYAEQTTSTCFSQSDFIDTLQVASIVVGDAEGNPVAGASVSSLSGVDYSLPASTTPEPSSLALLGTGVVATLGAFRRRRSRRVAHS